MVEAFALAPGFATNRFQCLVALLLKCFGDNLLIDFAVLRTFQAPFTLKD